MTFLLVKGQVPGHHSEEFLADLRSGERPLKIPTLRSYTTAIRTFTSCVSDTRYGWVAFCDRAFNDIPAQIVFDWNSPRHSTDDDVPTGRRALTRNEMQSLFDAAHPNSNWVFPGRHLEPGYIADRLRTTLGVRAARLGALHELTKLAPSAIIAEVLGYSPATIELHARGSAANYASYIKARLDGSH